MKYRIIITIVLLIILGFLYITTTPDAVVDKKTAPASTDINITL